MGVGGAAAGLVAASDSVAGTLEERIASACERVADSVRAGDAQRVLDRWVEFSRENS